MSCPINQGTNPSKGAKPEAPQPPSPAPAVDGGYSIWRMLGFRRQEAQRDSACPKDGVSAPRQQRSTIGNSGSGGAGDEGCPVSDGAKKGLITAINPLNNERVYSQVPSAHQKAPLSKERIVSSIPKADFTPKHQPQGAEKWVYPSEQQYYNAMRTKGYSVNEGDVGVVLAIHNAVNEQGWKQVLDWERQHCALAPRLKKFMGRPKDRSPKAWLMCMMGYSPPFDRHDWIIQRADGREVRYVIDYYTGAPVANKPVTIHLDVRPALDSFEALSDRVTRQVGKWATGVRSTVTPLLTQSGIAADLSKRPAAQTAVEENAIVKPKATA